MRLSLAALLLFTPLLLCSSLSAQAGQVIASGTCGDNQSAGTADLLPLQGSCFQESYGTTAYEAVTAQGTVDQYSLSTAVTSEVLLTQDGSVLSEYQSVSANRIDYIWFDSADYADPIVVRMTWVVDTGDGTPFPDRLISSFQAKFGSGGDSELPQCDFINRGVQDCVVTRMLTPGKQGGAFLILRMGSSTGYVNVVGSADDDTLLTAGATAQLISVEILDQNLQPLDTPPNLMSDAGFTYPVF